MKETQVVEKTGCPEAELKPWQKMMITGCDRDLRSILQYALDSYGCQPLFCENAGEALHNSTIEEYDYILVDDNTPGMNGLELTRRLRERYPLAIIIGMSAEDREVAFLRAGANDYLRKPFVPYRLAMMITGADILA